MFNRKKKDIGQVGRMKVLDSCFSDPCVVHFLFPLFLSNAVFLFVLDVVWDVFVVVDNRREETRRKGSPNGDVSKIKIRRQKL